MNLDRFQNPDAGDDNRFREYGAPEKEVEIECENCSGSGKFEWRDGDRILHTTCKACKGSGIA